MLGCPKDAITWIPGLTSEADRALSGLDFPANASTSQVPWSFNHAADHGSNAKHELGPMQTPRSCPHLGPGRPAQGSLCLFARVDGQRATLTPSAG